MQVKKEVYNKIMVRLENEILSLQRQRDTNKRNIQHLAEEQKKIKQEQTVLVDLIREVKIKKG